MPATTALETRATELLHELAGPSATFREHQLEAIADLVEDRARVLCVQRTGWGKSAVYFIATALLRERGAGPALIVSPLLALMRNQIAAAQRLGIRAHTVNSTNRDAWDEISALLDADAVDLLLISPERLNNPQFRARMLPVFAERVGLLVVDEAHCICDWGHDFRPDYRRIADMLERLPDGVGVLCTTATANDRVVADVEEQLRTGHSGAPLVAYRGPLGRTSLRFEVVELPGQADRLAWLATYLDDMPGSGIVYTLTKRDAEQVAQWLTAHGVAAEAYTGEIETERRIAVEDRLLANDLKCVVATSALGMGYDKPDLGFVVHYQAPGSVIAYYQQVGRAGRAIERAEVVLLRGAEDRRIQDFFIEQAFPRRELVDRVLEHLDGGRRRGRLDARADRDGQPRPGPHRRDAQGARRRGRRLARRQPLGARDRQRLGLRRRALRAHHRAAPPRAGDDGDASAPTGAASCARCRRSSTIPTRRTAGAARSAPRRATTARSTRGSCARRSTTCARSRSQLETKKMAPDPEGRMRKIPAEFVVEEGRALARLGDGGWAPVVQAGLREGRFSDELLDAVDALVRAWNPPVRCITVVPSVDVPRASSRTSRGAWPPTLGIPFVALLERTGDRPPQREMANAALQAANVRGAFRVDRRPAARERPAARRHAPERLDARDDRRPAAAGAARARSIPLVLATAF